MFLLDSDFTIERPKRYYRQGLHLLQNDDDDDTKLAVPGDRLEVQSNPDNASFVGSITKTMSRMFRLRRPHTHSGGSANGRADTDSESDSDSEFTPSAPQTPLLDPSTNTNPLGGASGRDEMADEGRAWDADNRKRHRIENDVSKHTFIISNAQMKLKLFAKNEVRDMPSTAVHR